MFEKLRKKLESLKAKEPAFDPSRFNDPVATTIDWTPVNSGGASFRTHKLVKVNPFRLEFRPCIGAILFYLIFLVPGIGIVIGSVVYKLSMDRLALDWETVVPVLFGLVFFAVGAGLLYFGTAPIVFDKQKRFFWKGRKAPDRVPRPMTDENVVELQQIHAIQILSEYCSGSDSSFTSYELNLVLENGKRINVVDHGNQKKLREDAAMLSTFLMKPVWDATVL